MKAANCVFDNGEFVFPLRVYYEDTDFSGFVYHASYLRFFERGRSEALRLAGVSHHDLLALEPPAAMVVRHMDITFVRPAVVEDDLIVRSHFTHARGARVRIEQALERGDEVIAKVRVEAALINLDGRPRKFPADIADKLSPFIAPATP